MGKAIAYEDIKPGDKVRVTDVKDVTITSRDGAGRLQTEQGYFLNRSNGRLTTEARERTFELLDRPVPPLPKVLGSVIELNGDGGRWVLIHDYSKGYDVWVKVTSGTRQSVAFMQSWVKQHEGFKVIS